MLFSADWAQRDGRDGRDGRNGRHGKQWRMRGMVDIGGMGGLAGSSRWRVLRGREVGRGTPTPRAVLISPEPRDKVPARDY